MIYIINKMNYIYHFHSVGEKPKPKVTTSSFRATGSSVTVDMWLSEISHAMLTVKT
jgi:hypothetical protein